MIKIAVIIPIYNGEEYIDYAIQSVLGQPYKNIEIIVINDGSVDNSEKIVRSYKDVKYIYQSNQGVAVARNRGMIETDADYIAFLDHDDFYIRNALDDELIQNIELTMPDMVSFAYYHCNQKGNRGALVSRSNKNIADCKKYAGENYRHHSSYLYKRSFLMEHGIKINGNRNEDERFRMQCVYKAKSMMYTSRILFAYRNNKYSVTHKNEQHKILYEDIMDGYRNLMMETDDDEIKQYSLDSFLHVALEFAQGISGQKDTWSSIDQVFEKNDIYNLYNLHGWMSEKDKKDWHDLLYNRKRFITNHKYKNKKIKIMRKISKWPVINQIYEKRKYPIRIKGNDL